MLGIIGAFCCLLYALICWLTGDTTSTWMALTVGVVCLLLTVRRISTGAVNPTGSTPCRPDRPTRSTGMTM